MRDLEPGARRAGENDALEFTGADDAAIHALIAAIAERHGASAGPEDVLEVARGLRRRKLAPVYRQSARQRVTTAAAFYFRRFRPVGWRFVGGAETSEAGIAFDLLWEQDGLLVADELKPGPVAGTLAGAWVPARVADLAAAGRESWGESFLGVRVIILASPDESYFEVP